VTELEIQKIAYFLQVLGQPLKLDFTKGLYGPYAEQLQHVLQAMEGHFIVGYGDRSSKVQELRPIRLMPDAAPLASAWLETQDPAAIQRVDELVALVDGFETPYSLELLATVHFAAAQEPIISDVGRVTERVRNWSGRKARLFTVAHTAVAHARLGDAALLPV
jgi:hypothetical protein